MSSSHCDADCSADYKFERNSIAAVSDVTRVGIIDIVMQSPSPKFAHEAGTGAPVDARAGAAAPGPLRTMTISSPAQFVSRATTGAINEQDEYSDSNSIGDHQRGDAEPDVLDGGAARC
jgi:hypothetical protein